MKRTILMLLGCLLATAAAQATPIVGVSGQGMDFTFDNGLAPNTYGAIPYLGDVSTDGGVMTMNNPGEFIRTYTTNDGGTYTAMPENEDWVAEIVLKHSGAYASDAVMFAKCASSTGGEEHRLFMMTCEGTTDNWAFYVGNDSGGWYSVATGLVMGGDFNTVVVHYKSAMSNLDVYLNDTLIAENKAAGYGRYDLQTIQVQNIGAGVDDVDSLKVGQVVPEPATLSLLAIGGIFALRRRRTVTLIRSF